MFQLDCINIYCRINGREYCKAIAITKDTYSKRIQQLVTSMKKVINKAYTNKTRHIKMKNGSIIKFVNTNNDKLIGGGGMYVYVE